VPWQRSCWGVEPRAGGGLSHDHQRNFLAALDPQAEEGQ
jgi:hypothetical protein